MYIIIKNSDEDGFYNTACYCDNGQVQSYAKEYGSQLVRKLNADAQDEDGELTANYSLVEIRK